MVFRTPYCGGKSKLYINIFLLFFTLFKIYHLYSLLISHDDFDSADTSSVQARVVRRLEITIHRINFYPVGNC